MVELLNAIAIIKQWNKLSLDEVVKKTEEFTGTEIPKKEIEEFRFTGLNNLDFLKLQLADYVYEEGKK